MSPTKVVKSGTCNLYLPPVSRKKKESPRKEPACPVLHLPCWHIYGRYPGRNVDAKTKSKPYLFNLECVSTVRKDLTVPRISLHLWGMDRVVWGGKQFDACKQKVSRFLKSGAKSRRSGEASQQVGLVSGRGAGLSKSCPSYHREMSNKKINSTRFLLN